MNNIKENLKQALAPLYDELFTSSDIGFDRKNETAFVLQWGENFPIEKNTGILFVGKSVNGWKEEEERTFENLFARHDQMKWIDDSWEAKDRYATGKSAFWRVIYGIMSQYDKDANPWYAYTAWSNLYKISPADEGNPNATQKNKQLEICRKIFKTEIDILSPKFVIMLVSDWKNDFLKYLNDNQPVQSIEKVSWNNRETEVYKIHNTFFITSVHPQGKKEDIHVKTIVNFLKKYQYDV
jgi:hypothetical protein